MTTRTIIIGDVHGMTRELAALLTACEVTPQDRVISVGDLIHKGPDPGGTVRLAREAGIELVLGNHEEQQARFRGALARLRAHFPELSDEELATRTKMKDPEKLLRTEQSLSAEDVAYLESAALFASVPGGVVVHAGILTELQSIPSSDEIANLSKARLNKLKLVTRLRHVRGQTRATHTVEYTVEGDDAEALDLQAMPDRALTARRTRVKVERRGAFVQLGHERAGDPFWAEVYDGRFGTVFFGHNAFIGETQPMRFPHAVGLDLGAVYGGHLAAAVLDARGDMRFVTVPAERAWATPLAETAATTPYGSSTSACHT